MYRAWLVLLLLWAPLVAAGRNKLVVARNAQGQVLYLRRLDPRAQLGSPAGTKIPADRFYAWDPIFIEAGEYYSIDPLFIKAIYLVESGLRINVKSRAGAEGPGQWMPKSAAEIGVENPYDPYQAIWGTAAYLRRLCDAFHGDMRLMAAGYNAGESAVRQAGNRVPNIEETQNYVPSVLWVWDGWHRQMNDNG
jgi:soluble lytic murein transglycosylase-like protein